MNITLETLRLGTLTGSSFDVDYDTAVTQEMLGQAVLVVTLEGEEESITLDLGEMGEGASEAATTLRALADELDKASESYEYLPTRFDAFIFRDDRTGRYFTRIEDAKEVDAPLAVSEAGAIATLELEMRRTGCGPAAYLVESYGANEHHELLTREKVVAAIQTTLAGGGWDADADIECAHCARNIVREDGCWVDPEATGDDSMWRETCDGNETFEAEHAPTLPLDEEELRAALAELL